MVYSVTVISRRLVGVVMTLVTNRVLRLSAPTTPLSIVVLDDALIVVDPAPGVEVNLVSFSLMMAATVKHLRDNSTASYSGVCEYIAAKAKGKLKTSVILAADIVSVEVAKGLLLRTVKLVFGEDGVLVLHGTKGPVEEFVAALSMLLGDRVRRVKRIQL